MNPDNFRMLGRVENAAALARSLEREAIVELHKSGVPVHTQLNAFCFRYHPEADLLERVPKLSDVDELADHLAFGCAVVSLLVHLSYQEMHGIESDERAAIYRDLAWYAGMHEHELLVAQNAEARERASQMTPGGGAQKAADRRAREVQAVLDWLIERDGLVRIDTLFQTYLAENRYPSESTLWRWKRSGRIRINL